MALLKLLKVDLCFQPETLLAKKPPFSKLTELALRETLIGLIMFAVMSRLTGTRVNMRHESQ